jgi:hypothetical protein
LDDAFDDHISSLGSTKNKSISESIIQRPWQDFYNQLN